MAIITVDQARAGMTLAAPLADRRGRMLVPAGHELGERHVQALRTWGVTQLEIDGEDVIPDATSDFAQEILDQAREETEEAFAENDAEDPFIEALRRFAVQGRAAHIAAAEERRP
jgi:hypothetical protein